MALPVLQKADKPKIYDQVWITVMQSDMDTLDGNEQSKIKNERWELCSIIEQMYDVWYRRVDDGALLVRSMTYQYTPRYIRTLLGKDRDELNDVVMKLLEEWIADLERRRIGKNK